MGIFDKIKDALDGDKPKEPDTRTEDVPFDPTLDLPTDQPDAPADESNTDGTVVDETVVDETVVAPDDAVAPEDAAAVQDEAQPEEVGELQAEMQSVPEPQPAQSEPAPVQNETYTVVEGDNLTWIGERFGVTVDDLVNANNIENPDLIYPGQVLTIPR